MYRIGLVIQQANQIEQILRGDFYGEGNGLAELTRFLEKILPEDIVRRIMDIARARNKWAHELNPPHDFDLQRYLKNCQDTALALMKLRSEVDPEQIAAKIPPHERTENTYRLNQDRAAFKQLAAWQIECARKQGRIRHARCKSARDACAAG